jgi:hypothetical protein
LWYKCTNKQIYFRETPNLEFIKVNLHGNHTFEDISFSEKKKKHLTRYKQERTIMVQMYILKLLMEYFTNDSYFELLT